MRCYNCEKRNVPCVYELEEVYSVYVVQQGSKLSHDFLSLTSMINFIEGLDEDTLIALYVKDMYSGNYSLLT